jgi:hypothetical protein
MAGAANTAAIPAASNLAFINVSVEFAFVD